MSFIGGLQGGFDQARVMTDGGPAGTTTTLAYQIYTKAFEQFQVGYASAISWVLFSIILVITLINWRIGSKDLNY
jgi:multiple sugar transport system permease protein